MAPGATTAGYQETAPSRELRERVLCGWAMGPVSAEAGTILPDGCIDIVWREGRGLLAVGPDTAAAPASRPVGSTVVGVRFRPGAAPGMLGIPASELRDLRVPLTELWGSEAERLDDALADAGSASARLRLIEDALRRRLPRAGRPDGLVAAAVMRLYSNDPGRVRVLGDVLGISNRQLRRRFHAAVGYGPKTLARVLRLQRVLALASRRGTARGDLARLALDAGYADQSHMTAEITRLSGDPPARLLASRHPVTAGI